jgi:tetratricopeptide (TPR) repeat protein
MLDVQLFGLKPRWHHLTNLLFHIANTLLIFFIFHRMTKAPWKSAFVAALFAVHPLHVQSVAWVAERKDVLSTFFWMLATVAYIHYVEHRTEDGRQRSADGEKWTGILRFPPSVFRYLAVVIFFAVGLMAKPMLVTLPFTLLLLDYWPLQRFEQKKPAEEVRTEVSKRGAGTPASAGVTSSLRKSGGKRGPLSADEIKGKSGKKRTWQGMVKEEKPAAHTNQWALVRPLLLEKIPLLALAALSCIVTYFAQKKGGAVISFEGIPPGVRIANALVSYIIYIGKTIWPNNLAVLYPHPGVRPLWQVLGAVLFLGAVTFAVIRTAKRFPYLAMGWLWFAGTLVPVIGIVQVGVQAMADRYTYIPLIGLFVMAAWGIPELLKKWRYRKEVLFASSALILPCLAVVTWTQAGYWRNSIALCDHALKVANQNDTIYENRADANYRLGNLRQAIEDFDKAVEIDPKNAGAYCSRGFAYAKLGDHRQAISDYDRAIEINPKLAEAYNGRGAAYAKLGDQRKAISDFDKSVEINPENAEAYYNRGATYGKLGNRSQAISDYDRAIEINREYALAYINRGVIYGELGNQGQAISDYERAIGIDPENADAYNDLAIAHGRLGNHWLALEDCDRAIGINPKHAEAYYNRGVAHSKLGNLRQAVEDMKKAANFGNEDAKNSLRSAGINW